jgi:hypothetical protein
MDEYIRADNDFR